MAKNKHSEYVRSTGELAYFAASNSRNGFYSYYGDCFDRAPIGRLYAIKGGPGTGKSRFMREVADCGAENGWECETVYCSSDPDSLDGVILFGKGEGIALLDATSPHVYEPALAGARENLINLGSFWNESRLRACAQEILTLDQQKKEAYRRAYRYLSAYGSVSENHHAYVSLFYRKEAIASLATRLLQEVPDGEGFLSLPALMRSVGMRGVVFLDTYLSQAKKIFLIEDCRGSAYCLTEALYRCVAQKRLRVRVSRDPILFDRIDGLFLCDCGYAFVVMRENDCTYPFKKISMRRFVETSKMRPFRKKVDFAERMRGAMLDGAMEELEAVRVAHFRLEEIYSSAMDFSEKEAFTKKFCESLFHLKTE